MRNRLTTLSVLVVTSLVLYFALSGFICEIPFNPQEANAGITSCTISIKNLDMKMDSFGFPHICYLDKADNDKIGIFYLKWNGRNWKTLTGKNLTDLENLEPIQTFTDIRFLNFDLDTANKPHFAWFDGDRSIIYSKWVKNELSSDPANSIDISVKNPDGEARELRELSFSLDNHGIPYIAWVESTAIDNIFLLKKVNRSWIGYEGSTPKNLLPLFVRENLWEERDFRISDIEIHFDCLNHLFLFYLDDHIPAYIKIFGDELFFPIQFLSRNTDYEYEDEVISRDSKLACAINQVGNPHVMYEAQTRYEPTLFNMMILIVDNGKDFISPNPSDPILQENENQIMNTFYTTKFKDGEVFEDEIAKISDIATDNHGTTHIVWSKRGLDSGRIPEIGYAKTKGEQVVCFDGSKWDSKKVNISKSKTTISINPKIELDKAGYPNICWIEKPKNARLSSSEKYRSTLCFMRWNGKGWVVLSGK